VRFAKKLKIALRTEGPIWEKSEDINYLNFDESSKFDINVEKLKSFVKIRKN